MSMDSRCCVPRIVDPDRVLGRRDPDGGENIITQLASDRTEVFVFQDTTDIVDGLPSWKIFEWRDLAAEGGENRCLSWGTAKYYSYTTGSLPELVLRGPVSETFRSRRNQE
ncbi:MAG: hypothetical protein R3E12_13635 [Candidatus Eisenbacteria bacterium]|uniref:Uncharacterized protein n=1 Tax=Eiseniibacteriota bacterium TaxID=2212470 RepID=A0A956RRT0_UNCEI|nr:hypothetical protein [Candidatus Eisenbacteria bacterium]